MSPPILAHHHHGQQLLHQQTQGAPTASANGLQPALSAIKLEAGAKHVYSAPVAMTIAQGGGASGNGGGANIGVGGNGGGVTSIPSQYYTCGSSYAASASASPPGITAVSAAEQALLTQAGSYSKHLTTLMVVRIAYYSTSTCGTHAQHSFVYHSVE